MGKQREWARQCVAELAKQCPEALDLARLLSPAIRVESALIRTMRLTMLPGSGAWIEAELWFSPLVKSRNVASLLFQPAVVDYLQAELTELWQQPDKQSELSTARMVMEEVHKNMSPALLLEEKVAWAAIAGNLDEINEEIAPAVKALLESTGRPGLVSWAGQAMHRLPNSAFKTDAGQVLRVIAQKAWPGAEESSTTSLPTVNCPAQLFETLPLVSMGVARRGPLILLGALSPSAPHVIPVPDTEPRLVDLRWEEKGLSKSHRLSVPVGGQAEWMVGPSSSVELHNVRGQVFQAPEFVPWAGGRSNWLELSVTANHNKEIFTLLWTRNGEKIQQEVAKYSPRVLEELLSASWPTDWQDFDGQGIFGDWLVKLFQIISLPRKLAERLPVQSDLHLILDQLSGRIPWEYWLFSLGMTGRMVRAQRKQSTSPPADQADNPNTLIAYFGTDRSTHMNTAGQNLTEAGFYVEQAEGGSPKDFLDRFFNTPWRLVHLYVPAEVGQPAEEGESFAGSIHIGRDIFFSTSEFKELRQLPEIVIIHAWPQPGRSFATNWGSELYKIGINVVLVNDWPLSEETAQIFLETFYQVLLAGSTASESILIARLETKRLFPQSAAWAAFQLHGNGDYRLSLPRKAKPSAKEKITPAADPDPFGLQAIRVLEARNVPKPGLYRVAVSPEFQLLDVKIEVLSAEEPVLLLIHAMASKTEAAFAGLWSDVHREQWNAISSVYGESIFCFEHWGLSKSPVENALALVRTLPPGLRIHMISLSSGGLMAELLCRGQRVNGPPVDEVDLKGFPSEQGHVLEQLGRELSERQLQIERFIRIACPVRGTSYPMRSKQILGKVAKALRYVGVVINNIILAQFEAIADPQKIPGLRAIYPDSPLIAMLNRTDVHLEGDLSIVAGTYRPQSITGKLTAKITDLLLAEDNDLVVPTESMYGGSERLTPARFVHFEGSQINHFSYFEQREVVNTIVGRLLEREVGTVWKAVTYESTEIPTLLVIYDPGIDNTVNVDQCAAALAPLENQGLVRLSFSEMQQLAELKTKSLLLSVLQTTRLALVLVTPELLASKGLQVALEYLQPRANNDECKIMPIIFGEVDWKKSALINYQALRIDGTEEREQGHDNAAWQILVNHVITYLPSIVPKPVVNGEKATVDGDE